MPPPPPTPPAPMATAPHLAFQRPLPTDVRVVNGFSLGFYAFFGAFVASIAFWIVAGIVLFGIGILGSSR